jgi:hypothetical protein
MLFVVLSLPTSVLAQDFASPMPTAPVIPSASTVNSKPLVDLMASAQQLRDATHDLVRDRALEGRNQAIQKIDRTLAQVQSAMMSLPANVLLADANATPSQKATDDLARAADHLNDAVTALKNTGSAGPDQQALTEIRKALSSVQQERLNLQSASTETGREAGSKSSARAQNLPEELKLKMQSAGYTNVEIVPGSYLVSARDKDGQNVMMRIGPHSMTVLSEVNSEKNSTGTIGKGASGPQ